ncbi:MAG: bifunctional phosphopantothenoylcysteine decarboxylase/phosphopantothenate--cysteine ligase CoaBC [Candidatus Limnocylindrales bacterium]
MSALAGRLVLLGVTGSIAAYKSAELARALIAARADVQPLMTHSAQAFLGPLTLQTLTRRRPMTDPLELLPDQRIAHIVAADSADAILVAPATARWLAAMANGLADDVITATCLASAAPVVIAPAMDGEMYAHPATRGNVEKLRSYGYTIVEPEIGPLASGQVGRGRLAEPAEIMAAVNRAVEGKPIRQPDPEQRPPVAIAEPTADLDGWHVVVTAGGTAEPIDPVRYIGNRSSGKMGVAIAEAALARGARVTLIHGLPSVPLPDAAELVSAPTAADMERAVLDKITGADVLVMAAAVADFRPRNPGTSKLARADGLTLELEPTNDILAEAVRTARPLARRPVIVGFAAETGSLERAREKAERKGVDLLVANDVAEEGSGFGTDTNRVTIVVPGEPDEPWPMMSKVAVARRLLDRIVALRAAKSVDDASESASLTAR